MPRFERGTVVRVPFPYTDLATRQQRPALVVSVQPIGAGDFLIWVLMITSAENRPWQDDVPLGPDFTAFGLPAPSVVRTAKIATIEAAIAAPLGRITSAYMDAVDERLRGILGLR